MERALARSSKQLLRWKSERNRLIKQAYIDGAGVREIARAADLSHPAVIRIVKGIQELDPDEKAALNEELNKRRTGGRGFVE